MARLSFVVVLLLIVFSFGKPGKALDLKSWFLKLRTPPTTAAPKPTVKTTVKPAVPGSPLVFKNGLNWRDINSTDKFYEVFKLERLPQHKKDYKRPGTGIASSVDPFDPRVLSCSPKPKVIDLPRPQFGQVIYPACAVVDRCGGCCSVYTHMSCKPTAERQKTIYYYNLASSASSGMSMSVDPGMSVTPTLTWIDEVDHVGCSCQCSKTAASCNSLTQTWNEDRCECECKLDYQSHKLKCKEGFEYDPNTCSCVCAKAPESCRTLGHKWSHTDCRCVCKDNSRCQRLHYRDPNSCRCVSATKRNPVQ